MLAIDTPTTERTSPEPGAAIGLAIRYARKAAGLSGEKLAEATGLSLRTIVKIEQGNGAVALGRYKTVACELGLEWMFDVFGRDTSDEALGTPKYYLSGMTALCLPPADGRPPALWYTSSLSNPSSWRIAGKHTAHTGALLGVAGLWNATATIAQYGVVAPCIWAANPERAVFDLLIDSCEIRQCRVPNVQVTDIDDVVNLEQVREWVAQCEPFLSDAARERIEDWLNGGHQ
jgi:hypothetical protein